MRYIELSHIGKNNRIPDLMCEKSDAAIVIVVDLGTFLVLVTEAETTVSHCVTWSIAGPLYVKCRYKVKS